MIYKLYSYLIALAEGMTGTFLTTLIVEGLTELNII